MRGFEIERHAQLLGLTRQFNRAILLPRRMPIFRRLPARAPESGNQIERFIGDRRPVFGGDFLKPVSRQIGIW